MKSKFKKGQRIKTPKGEYNISYFLEVTNMKYYDGELIKRKRNYFEPGFLIMVKGVGVYNEDEVVNSPEERKELYTKEEVHNLMTEAWINGEAKPNQHYTVREEWVEKRLNQ